MQHSPTAQSRQISSSTKGSPAQPMEMQEALLSKMLLKESRCIMACEGRVCLGGLQS